MNRRSFAAFLAALALAPIAAAAASPAGLFDSVGPDAPLTAARRDALLEMIADRLQSGYAIAARGEELATWLRAQAARGRYGDLRSSLKFAARVSQDLRRESRDPHMRVIFRGTSLPVPKPLPPGEAPKDVLLGRPEKNNFEYHDARWLPGNVGYLKIASFGAPAALARPVLEAAMAFLQRTDALIIDIRGNRGGGPDGVLALESFLFDGPQLMTTIHFRNATDEHPAAVPNITTDQGARAYGQHKPVYVLTSSDTFSAAESLAYTLQAHGRAKVVGERTAGGAHPTSLVALDAYFGLLLPIAYSTHPVTQTDWEAKGVQPTIVTRAADSAGAAYLDALTHLAAREQTAAGRAELLQLKARAASVAQTLPR